MIEIKRGRRGRYKNSIVLDYDSWDDFGYNTMFHFYYYDSNGTLAINSIIHIYNVEMDFEGYNKSINVYLPQIVVQLDDSYCSIGHDIEFYLQLKKYFPNEYYSILRRLNDIAVNVDIREKFIGFQGVQSSLFRSSSTFKALNEASKLFDDDLSKASNYSFDYMAKSIDGIIETKLSFDFNIDKILPYRINILVGKNGVGKTSILSKLSRILSGYVDDNEYDEFKNFISLNRPPFDKVLTVAFSAFDSFKRKKLGETPISYSFCGFDYDLFSSKKNINAIFWKYYNIIKDKNRESIWIEIANQLFFDEYDNMVKKVSSNDSENISFSSGEGILLLSMTEVIAEIEQGSIILFDEPEIHLHPNAITNMMRMLNTLLNRFNSFAIMATHSPQILQEIPSKYINILENIDQELIVRKPSIECYGESISYIIDEVFPISKRESAYQSTFINLKKEGYSKKDIINAFKGNIGLCGLIFLNSIYGDGND